MFGCFSIASQPRREPASRRCRPFYSKPSPHHTNRGTTANSGFPTLETNRQTNRTRQMRPTAAITLCTRTNVWHAPTSESLVCRCDSPAALAEQGGCLATFYRVKACALKSCHLLLGSLVIAEWSVSRAVGVGCHEANEKILLNASPCRKPSFLGLMEEERRAAARGTSVTRLKDTRVKRGCSVLQQLSTTPC